MGIMPVFGDFYPPSALVGGNNGWIYDTSIGMFKYMAKKA
jgi:hypothetical protein